MPADALAYLVRVAERLGARPPAKVANVRKHVFTALEFDAAGGPSVFEQRRRFELERAIRAVAANLQAATGLSADDALEHAAEDARRDAASIRRQQRRRADKTRRVLSFNPPS
jgi:hypothetical protein